MRIGEILINNSGVLQNPSEQLIVSSPITGDASSTLYLCQATLEFFNSVITTSSGLIVPNVSSVVTSGLSGSLTLNIYPSQYSPYATSISSGSTLTIASQNVLQWTGVVSYITFTSSSITGCNYIRVLLDRN